MIDKKNLNRNLIIYKLLYKCGYKVLYNKKERLPIQINNKKNPFFFIRNQSKMKKKLIMREKKKRKIRKIRKKNMRSLIELTL